MIDPDPGLVRGKSPDPDAGPAEPTDAEIAKVFDELRYVVSAGTKYLSIHLFADGGFMVRGYEMQPVVEALAKGDLVVRVNANPKSQRDGGAAAKIIGQWCERAKDAAVKMREHKP